MGGKRSPRATRHRIGAGKLPREPNQPRRAGLKAGAALLLLVMTVAAYWPAAQCGFTWDDDDYVQNNQTLRSADGLRRNWLELGATHQYYSQVHTSY